MVHLYSLRCKKYKRPAVRSITLPLPTQDNQSCQFSQVSFLVDLCNTIFPPTALYVEMAASILCMLFWALGVISAAYIRGSSQWYMFLELVWTYNLVCLLATYSAAFPNPKHLQTAPCLTLSSPCVTTAQIKLRLRTPALPLPKPGLFPVPKFLWYCCCLGLHKPEIKVSSLTAPSPYSQSWAAIVQPVLLSKFLSDQLAFLSFTSSSTSSLSLLSLSSRWLE